MPSSYYNPAVVEPMQFGPDISGTSVALLSMAKFFGDQSAQSQAFSMEKLRLSHEAVRDSYAQVLDLQREQREAQNQQFNQTMQMTKMAAETEMQRQQARAAQLALKNAQFEFDEKEASAINTKALAPGLAKVQLAVSQGDSLTALAELETLTTDSRYPAAKELQPVVAELTQKLGAVSVMTDSGPKTLTEIRNMLSTDGSPVQVEALRAVLYSSKTPLSTVDEKGNVVDRSGELFEKLAKFGVKANNAVQREQIKSLMSQQPKVMSPAEKAQYDAADAALKQKYLEESMRAAAENDFSKMASLDLGYGMARENMWQMYRFDEVSPFRSSKEMLIDGKGLDNIQLQLNDYSEVLMERLVGMGTEDLSPEALREIRTGGVKQYIAGLRIGPESLGERADAYEKLIAAQGGDVFGAAKPVAGGKMEAKRGPIEAYTINQRIKGVNYDFARLRAAMALLASPDTASAEATQQLMGAIKNINPVLEKAGMGTLEPTLIFGGLHWRAIQAAIAKKEALKAGVNVSSLTPSYSPGTLGPVAPVGGGFAGGIPSP